jgi:ribosomal protein S27E
MLPNTKSAPQGPGGPADRRLLGGSAVIEIQCDRCERTIQVEDDKAGQKIDCPYCGDVNRVPATSGATPGSSVSPSGTAEPDRAVAAGLPPDSGPEQHVCAVKPAMARAHPLLALILAILFVGGIVGTFALQPYMLILSLGVAIFWFGWWIKKQTVKLEITNKRTVVRKGLLSKSTSEVLHDHVRNIQMDQSLLGRILGVGSIGISSSGQDGIEIQVHDVPNPAKIRSVIDAYRPM